MDQEEIYAAQLIERAVEAIPDPDGALKAKLRERCQLDRDGDELFSD
jgi:hypothetical protein